MERRSSNSLNVLIHSSHALRLGSPDGVKDVILTQRKLLEQMGCNVTIIGPRIRSDQDNLADHKLGVAIKIIDRNTSMRTGWVLTKGPARKLTGNIRPDLVVMHEPLAFGNAGHSLLSGVPKREDGKPIPAVVGQFHAYAENLSSRMEFVKKGMKLARRPKFSSLGMPIGLTPGYVSSIMNSLDGKIAVSNATAGFWQDQIEGFVKEPLNGRFEVIFNAIDTEELTPDGPKIDSWNDGKKTILAAARHDPRKGLEYGITALGLLVSQGRKDMKLMITGEGSETESLKALVKKLELSESVKFVGILSREELVKAYRTADVFISPAIGWEGFGRTLAEAMSTGTLVVASDINGYREVMHNKPFTRAVKPQDPNSLAKAIAQILDLPDEETTRLKREARDYVIDNFSLSVIADQTIRYFDKVLIAHGIPKKEDWDLNKKRKTPRFGTWGSGIIFPGGRV